MAVGFGMHDARMVLAVRLPDAFSAKVAAARLGAEGIVWQLRGSVDGPYPLGEVDLLVEEQHVDVARALLRGDDALDAPALDEDVLHRRHHPLLVAGAAVAIIAALATSLARVVTLL